MQKHPDYKYRPRRRKHPKRPISKPGRNYQLKHKNTESYDGLSGKSVTKDTAESNNTKKSPFTLDLSRCSILNTPDPSPRNSPVLNKQNCLLSTLIQSKDEMSGGYLLSSRASTPAVFTTPELSPATHDNMRDNGSTTFNFPNLSKSISAPVSPIMNTTNSCIPQEGFFNKSLMFSSADDIFAAVMSKINYNQRHTAPNSSSPNIATGYRRDFNTGKIILSLFV